MNKNWGTMIAILVAGALACAAFAMAQSQKPAPVPPRDPIVLQSPNDMHVTGVNVVRLVNTAEGWYKNAHHRYASWDELYRSGIIAQVQKEWPQVSGFDLSVGPEIVPGWTLALIPSADGKSYELSLRNLQDKCQLSFFSDQRGLIYEGHVIGCAAQMMPAHQ